MTNNPNKIRQLEQHGIGISGRIPLVMPANPYNRFYLRTKAARSGISSSHGTRCLIAAFDIRSGKVFGQLRKRRTAKDLAAFMAAVARRYPTGDVYVVWDNLNVHHGEAY